MLKAHHNVGSTVHSDTAFLQLVYYRCISKTRCCTIAEGSFPFICPSALFWALRRRAELILISLLHSPCLLAILCHQTVTSSTHNTQVSTAGLRPRKPQHVHYLWEAIGTNCTWSSMCCKDNDLQSSHIWWWENFSKKICALTSKWSVENNGAFKGLEQLHFISWSTEVFFTIGLRRHPGIWWLPRGLSNFQRPETWDTLWLKSSIHAARHVAHAKYPTSKLCTTSSSSRNATTGIFQDCPKHSLFLALFAIQNRQLTSGGFKL